DVNPGDGDVGPAEFAGGTEGAVAGEDFAGAPVGDDGPVLAVAFEAVAQELVVVDAGVAWVVLELGDGGEEVVEGGVDVVAFLAGRTNLFGHFRPFLFLCSEYAKTGFSFSVYSPDHQQ